MSGTGTQQTTATPSVAQQEVYVAIWSKAVETQMHFNEMSVKSRQFGLAFVAASLGLGIALLSRGEEFAIPINICGGFDLHVSVLIVISGALALSAVRVLDLNVYHKMLRGAVTFGEDFEQHYMKQIFDLEKGMTQAISHYSRHQDANVDKSQPKYHYTGQDQKDAYKKIKQFYDRSTIAITLAAVLLFLITAHFGHPSQRTADSASQRQTSAPNTTTSTAPPSPSSAPTTRVTTPSSAAPVPAPKTNAPNPHG